MPLISYECASPRFRHKPPNWILMIKVTFKSTLALRRWLVCTIFFAINHLHVRTHFSKNYSPISLHGFTLMFSITLFMSTLRMKSQSIQSTLQLLHFILTTQLTFLEYFYIVLVFYATPKFLPQRRAQDDKKGPPAENDRRPHREPAGPTFQ